MAHLGMHSSLACGPVSSCTCLCNRLGSDAAPARASAAPIMQVSMLSATGWRCVHLLQPQLALIIHCLSRWGWGKRTPAGLHQTSASAGDPAGRPLSHHSLGCVAMRPYDWTCAVPYGDSLLVGQQDHTLQAIVTDPGQAPAHILASAGPPVWLPRAADGPLGPISCPHPWHDLI